MYATIPKGNVGYDQYTVPNDCSCRIYFCCFPLALANICPWPLGPFFQISLENRADKTIHNTLRDCRVHFFQQPFLKQLYGASLHDLTAIDSRTWTITKKFNVQFFFAYSLKIDTPESFIVPFFFSAQKLVRLFL